MPPSLPELPPRRRLVLLVAGWGVYCLCGPGVVWGAGSPLVVVGVALVALACSRPGRRAWLLEGLVGGLALGSQLWWSAYVWWPVLLWIVPGFALYSIVQAALLRRLARELPLAVATACAWVGVEQARGLLPPPFGLEWVQLAHYAAAWPALGGSARVWGPPGLSFAVALAGGALAAQLAGRLVPAAPGAPAGKVREAVLGLGPLLVALVLARVVPAPATTDGPRLLLVQPAFEQARKQYGSRELLFRDSLALTREGLARARGPVDLVCWGETMLPVQLADPGLADGVAAGLAVAGWEGLDAGELAELPDLLARLERGWVRLPLFGGTGPDGRALARLLPEGTSFLAGVETYAARDGRLRRENAVVLWGPDGARLGGAAKRHLVPGAETMLGLERFDAVRSAIDAIADYVPDFHAAEETGVLELPGPVGRPWRIGTSVCFDNAFLDPYTSPLRRGALDFHLVVSNEAWYLDSFEMDQMLAFSRLAALSTGRAVVRATNAGVTCAIGPDGRELARLRVDGEDRLVPGTLEVVVPVPSAGAKALVPPFAGLERAWRWLAVLTPLLAFARARLRAATAGRAEGGARA